MQLEIVSKGAAPRPIVLGDGRTEVIACPAEGCRRTRLRLRTSDTRRDDRRGSLAAGEAVDASAYYRFILRTKATGLADPDGTTLPIVPAMTATVEMLTGRETVLQYLLKPINRARGGLGER